MATNEKVFEAATSTLSYEKNNDVKKFDNRFDLYKKWSNIVVLPLGLLLIGATVYHFSWELLLLTVVVILLGLLPNCMWFVPTGFEGYQMIFERQLERSYNPGLNWRIPIIGVTNIIPTLPVSVIIKDTRKTVDRTDIIVVLTFQYRLKKETADIVNRLYGKNYEEILLRWVDAGIEKVYNTISFGHHLGNDLANIREYIVKFVEYEVRWHCMEDTKMEKNATEMEFSCPSLHILPTTKEVVYGPIKKIINDLLLEETTATFKGVYLFDSLTVTVNDTKFTADMQSAMDAINLADLKRRKAEIDKETTLINADAAKKAQEIIGEGRANSTQKLVDSLGGDIQAATDILVATEVGKSKVTTWVQGGKNPGVVVPTSNP